jgi:hypothetical protein
MTPARSASVRMFESLRALMAEDNLSTSDPKNVALEFAQPGTNSNATRRVTGALASPCRTDWTVVRPVGDTRADASRMLGAAGLPN